MTTIRSFMTEDHRRCDDLFAEAEQAVGKGSFDLARAAFGHFHSAMLAHFDSEEKTLFPTFEAKTGHGARQGLPGPRGRHRQPRPAVRRAVVVHDGAVTAPRAALRAGRRASAPHTGIARWTRSRHVVPMAAIRA